MKKKAVIITVIAAVGAIATTIFVIKKGPQLKRDLLNKVDHLKEKIKDIEVSDVKDAISSKLLEIKENIQDFDWNKPKKEVENKFHEIRNQLKSVKKHIPLTEVSQENKTN